MQNNQEFLSQLRAATSGLLWMSESEAPFEVFVWPEVATPLTAQKLLQQTAQALDTPVETVSLDAFFEVATQEQDWHEAEEKAEVRKYQQLVELIKLHLKEVQVYRVGRIHLNIYIVGTTEANQLAGLSTQVVET